jgi:ketosteroid isomerase-like protein
MMYRRNFSVIVGALLVLVCAVPVFAKTDIKDLEKQLRQTDLNFSRDTGERGLEAWLSYFDDKAGLVEADVKGKDALRAYYSKLFARKDLIFAWSPTEVKVFQSGKLGYTSGRYRMAFTAPNGARVSQTGSYLTVWRRHEDGKWKIVSDFGSPDEATK